MKIVILDDPYVFSFTPEDDIAAAFRRGEDDAHDAVHVGVAALVDCLAQAYAVERHDLN